MPISPLIASFFNVGSDVPQSSFKTWAESVESSISALESVSAGENLIVNGDFQQNQRGFAGGALAAGAFGRDRWGARTGGANYSVSGFVVTLTSGEIGQVVEPGAWGLSTLANVAVTISVDAPSANLTVNWGNASGTITAGSGRRSVTLTNTAGGNATLGIRRATAGSVTFGRVSAHIGTGAPPWRARDASSELRLCQRYYYRRARSGNFDVIFMVSFFNTSQAWGGTMHLPTTMRAAPTVAFSAAADFRAYINSELAISAINNIIATPDFVSLRGVLTVPAGSAAVGQAAMFYFNNSASGWLEFDSEFALS